MPHQPTHALTLADFFSRLAARTPTPGGGAAASVAGALGAALAGMVVNYSLGKKNLAPHEAENQQALIILSTAVPMLLDLADEDAAAYGAVNELSRLPEGDPRRAAELPQAQRDSVQVPMAVGAMCVNLLRRFEALAATTNRHLRSDLAIAAILADAATRAAACNVAVNLPSLPPAESEKARAQCDALLAESARLCALVERACAA